MMRTAVPTVAVWRAADGLWGACVCAKADKHTQAQAKLKRQIVDRSRKSL